MSDSGSKTAWAAYLVGHGPLREPRLLELQLMRILRYQGLLQSREDFRGYWGQSYVFADINYPRSKAAYSRQDFPQLYRMLEELETRSIGLVIMDVQESVGFYDDYSWIGHSFTGSDVRVVNAFYDSEKLLEEHIKARYQGNAYVEEIDDGSDLVNFFPTLSASVARTVLDSVFRYGDKQNRESEAVLHQLHRIAERSPYSGGREPFIQEDLLHKWFERLQKVKAEARVERRQREQLFVFAPRMAGLLIDEDLNSFGEARSSEELAWAEERVLQLGFERIVEGRRITYIFHSDGLDIYADIRSKPKIAFYIYKLPQQAKSSDTSNTQFDLPDRFTRDIQAKWRAAFKAAIDRRRGH